MDGSLLEVNGPPSSPFISQITDANSRASSKQYHDLTSTSDQGRLTDTGMPTAAENDKENIQPSLPESLTRYSSAHKDTYRLQRDERGARSSESYGSRDNTPSGNKTFKRPLQNTTSGNSPRNSAYTSPAHGHARSSSRNQGEATSIDDTCFSTFSEIQDLTWNKPQSPLKLTELANGSSPLRKAATAASRKRISPSRSPSPTSRRMRIPNDTVQSSPTCLIDFTEQMESFAPPRTLPISRTEPNLLQHLQKQRSPAKTTRASLATPGKQNSILDLLDFELPPAPTPRSVPTITVRELETLKSQYLSQISSLKATLNGREAEVESFKKAIGDAERRVGEAQEALREEKIRREQAEQEKLDWERRGLEVENVLKTVKEEILKADVEKEELIARAEACEKQAEEAQERASTAEEKLSAAEVAVAFSQDGAGGTDVDTRVQKLVAIQIDSKIEAVSRELHAVYKEKHERKVATLKQSYEARSQKRMADLQSKVNKLERANDELLVAKAALVPLPQADDGDLVLMRTQIEEHKGHLARVQQELSTAKGQREELVHALEQERIEKGDLVAAVDEMLALQAEQGPTQGAMSIVEDFRRSVSRQPSAALGAHLRAPGESKIGRVPQHARTPGGKSKMLANIERMGRANAIE